MGLLHCRLSIEPIIIDWMPDCEPQVQVAGVSIKDTGSELRCESMLHLLFEMPEYGG